MKTITILVSLLVFSAQSFGRNSEEKREIKKAACLKKKLNDSCEIEGRKGTFEGSCEKTRKDPSILFCKVARGQREMGLLKELNLSQEQIKKIEKFMMSQKEKRKKLRSEKKNSREKMRELFLSGKSDSEIRALHKQISKMREMRGELKLEKMLFLKNLLTSEQRKSYMDKKKKQRRRSK